MGRALPAVAGRVLSAIKQTGVRLVVMENLYGLGRVAGPMNEDTSINPNSRKGAVRAEMSRMLLAAIDAGEAQIAIGRASDYCGPGAAFPPRRRRAPGSEGGEI